MNKIIPAILPKSEDDLNSKLLEIPLEAGIVHIDIIEDDIWSEIDRPFEVHIMAESPEDLALTWAKRSPKRLIVHKFTSSILSLKNKMTLGLGIEYDTTLESVKEEIDTADFIQLMSIKNMGAQGRPFEEKIFDKIKEAKERFPNTPISVDGGVGRDNFQELLDAGANYVVSGSGFKELWSLQTKE